MATRSKAFGSKGPRAAHLVKPGGGLKAEVWDFRNDVEESFSSLEGRPVAETYPEIDWIDGGLLAAGGDHEIMGRSLLQGQAFAELDMDATHGLIFTALKPGEDGNDITVELISGGATSLTYVAGVLEITFNAGVDDDDAIATAVNADAAACNGYVMAVSSGTINAVGIVAAGVFGPTNLAGGEGEGWECLVTGEEALPANTTGATGVAAITELACVVTVPALNGLVDARAVGDVAACTITTDGVRADISAILA